MKVLTELAVQRTKAATKRIEIPDRIVPGLYLIVQPKPSEHKSWAVRYRIHGTPKKHTLGPWPTLDLAKARAKAREAIEAICSGKSPKQAELDKAAATPRTFAWLCEQYIERYAKPRKRTAAEDERALKGEFAAWIERTVGEIKKADVLAMIEAKAKTAPTRARRLFALLRKVFNWGVEMDLLTASPVAGIKAKNLPGRESSRDRVLTPDELRAFERSLARLEWPWAPCLRLVLLTGQRRGEVAGMRWPDLDLPAKVWTLPREQTKAGRVHDVPLTDEMLAILGALPKFEGTDLVFPARGNKEREVSGFSKLKARLDDLMREELAKMNAADEGEREFKAWRVHDLRRTCATTLQRLKFPPYVVSALLNHSPGAAMSTVTAVYARHRYAEERRTALEAWSRYLHELESPQAGGNVLPFAAASVNAA